MKIKRVFTYQYPAIEIMYILAFEIANFKYSIVLLYKTDDRVTVCEFEYSDNYRGESHQIITLIKRMMSQHNITFNELAFIAVTTGPGSFTGVRLGLAMAIGLRLASAIPVIAVDSCMVGAYAALHDNVQRSSVLVILESRRHDQYCQLWNHDLKALKPAIALQPEDIADYCDRQPVHVTGNGIVNINTRYRAHNWTYSETTMFDAQHVAKLALDQKDVLKHRAVLPYYLRLPNATSLQQ